MRPGVVMLKKLSLSINNWEKVRLQDVVDIALGCQVDHLIDH